VSTLKVGDPRDPETIIGPVINHRQAETLRTSIESGIKDGANPVLKGNISGRMVEPTILADVTTEMSVSQEELFGPVVCVMPFET
ncbi:aldehyde dehydrogenase, partial [Pseudomonas sp. MPR-R5A]